jgi:hypothetical protein
VGKQGGVTNPNNTCLLLAGAGGKEDDMSDTKKDVWELDVKRESVLKVVFIEPLTKAEAIKAFNDDEFEDIIDEEDHGVEAVGAR